MRISTLTMVEHAERRGYAVPAVNVFDEFSMRGAVLAAERCSSPLIVQISTKTARSLGVRLVTDLFDAIAGSSPVPVALHLDHCPDRRVIDEVVEAGWSSLLFDASDRELEAAVSETSEVVRQAHAAGVAVESEIENIVGVEDGVGSDEAVHAYSVSQLADIAARTGTDLLAPQLGTAHGLYTAAPVLLFGRAAEVRRASGRPVVLHGGTGLSDDEFRRFVRAGVSKINISTQCKRAYLQAGLVHLRQAEVDDHWDPPAYLDAVTEAVAASIAQLPPVFGSAGQAMDLLARAETLAHA
ncbi:tagatose bisphosphate family class II aldolase [Brooklawnia cerclae]|uniref:Fructose-bisphosphate aldolase class II n=1 Tax=Brooklawnia cerclae TaxID=349934 RepID=A0ABX0SFS3_9ACTN|nr:class II fructose-bisphosphate aldolase [Brooklawnia cerclae]NIH56168.1 fructose-bisphosphate aldolase class II [Brooklawnia cerclae]